MKSLSLCINVNANCEFRELRNANLCPGIHRNSKFVIQNSSVDHTIESARAKPSQQQSPPFAPPVDDCDGGRRLATALRRFEKTCETDRLLRHGSPSRSVTSQCRLPSALPHPPLKSSTQAPVQDRVSTLRQKL